MTGSPFHLKVHGVSGTNEFSCDLTDVAEVTLRLIIISLKMIDCFLCNRFMGHVNV